VVRNELSMGFELPRLTVDMAGCPNCRHCWLGAHRDGNMTVKDFHDLRCGGTSREALQQRRPDLPLYGEENSGELSYDRGDGHFGWRS